MTSKASEMPKVVGGLLALVALASSIFSGNDPWTCLFRGAIAFIAGSIVSTLWVAVTGLKPGVVATADVSEAGQESVATPTVVQPEQTPDHPAAEAA